MQFRLYAARRQFVVSGHRTRWPKPPPCICSSSQCSQCNQELLIFLIFRPTLWSCQKLRQADGCALYLLRQNIKHIAGNNNDTTISPTHLCADLHDRINVIAERLLALQQLLPQLASELLCFLQHIETKSIIGPKNNGEEPKKKEDKGMQWSTNDEGEFGDGVRVDVFGRLPRCCESRAQGLVIVDAVVVVAEGSDGVEREYWSKRLGEWVGFWVWFWNGFEFEWRNVGAGKGEKGHCWVGEDLLRSLAFFESWVLQSFHW